MDEAIKTGADQLTVTPAAEPAPPREIPADVLQQLIAGERTFVACVCGALFVSTDNGESVYSLLRLHRCPLAPPHSEDEDRSSHSFSLAIIAICAAAVLIAAIIVSAVK